MNWLDIMVLIFLIIMALVGFSKGLIRMVFPLIAVILGVFLAGRFHGALGDWLGNWMESSSQADIVAFAIIIVLAVIASYVAFMVLRGFMSMLMLGWIDKIGGLAFGLALGALISAAALALIAKFPLWDVQPTVRDSTLAHFLLDQFPFVLGLLPGDFDSVRQFFK